MGLVNWARKNDGSNMVDTEKPWMVNANHQREKLQRIPSNSQILPILVPTPWKCGVPYFLLEQNAESTKRCWDIKTNQGNMHILIHTHGHL